MKVQVLPSEIVRRGILGRRVRADQVRRVHRYLDESGVEGIVVRRSFCCFVHLSARDLADPELRLRLTALIDRVRHFAMVDPDVDRLLAAA
jgi:hypothetical protein